MSSLTSSKDYIMTCAKRNVIAVLQSRNCEEDFLMASNECNNPQDVCPREDGEDYTKCRTICQQSGHAETEVLKLVKSWMDLTYYDLTIIGHDRMCPECTNAIADAGIINITFKPRPDSMVNDQYTVTDVTAHEIALHTAMCVNMEYISSWGLLEFVSKLCEYVDDEDLEMLVKALNKMYGE